MRYIVKTTCAADANATTLQTILQAHKVHIVDGSLLPDMALVELDDEHVPQLRLQLGDQWVLYPEKKYSVPDTRKKIKK